MIKFQASTINNVVLAAAWSETGQVGIWDLSDMLQAVEEESSTAARPVEASPIFTFKGHLSEGFAIDWASTMPGLKSLTHV